MKHQPYLPLPQPRAPPVEGLSEVPGHPGQAQQLGEEALPERVGEVVPSPARGVVVVLGRCPHRPHGPARAVEGGGREGVVGGLLHHYRVAGVLGATGRGRRRNSERKTIRQMWLKANDIGTV